MDGIATTQLLLNNEKDYVIIKFKIIVKDQDQL